MSEFENKLMDLVEESIASQETPIENQPHEGSKSGQLSFEQIAQEQERSEGGEDSEEPETEEPEPLAAEKAETEAPKLYTIKVDGEEKQLTADELVAGYQMAQASQRRFEAAAAERKRAEAIIEALKADPAKALAEVGIDPESAAEELIAKKLRYELMSDEEKERFAMEEDLNRMRRERAQLEEERKQQEYQAEVQTHIKRWDNEISEALKSTNLPKTPGAVKRLVEAVDAALDAGYDASPKDLVPVVLENYKHELSSIIGPMSDAQLISFLGKDLVDRVRKTSLQGLKRAPTPSLRKGRTKPAAKRKAPPPIDEKDFKKYIEKLAYGD